MKEQRTQKTAMSLAEVVIAIAIISLFMTPAMISYTNSTKQIGKANHALFAASMARYIRQQMYAMNFDEIVSIPPTKPQNETAVSHGKFCYFADLYDQNLFHKYPALFAAAGESTAYDDSNPPPLPVQNLNDFLEMYDYRFEIVMKDKSDSILVDNKYLALKPKIKYVMIRITWVYQNTPMVYPLESYVRRSL